MKLVVFRQLLLLAPFLLLVESASSTEDTTTNTDKIPSPSQVPNVRYPAPAQRPQPIKRLRGTPVTEQQQEEETLSHVRSALDVLLKTSTSGSVKRDVKDYDDWWEQDDGIFN
jgi:hypothetical protein